MSGFADPEMADAMDPGTIIDGKYEIVRIIGKGGMSRVYLAVDLRLGKKWAVKEIRRGSGGRNDGIIFSSLIAEANLMKKLDHPALPRIVDIIEDGDTICIVMDYVRGMSLDKVIKKYGPQPEERVVEWAKQLCSALGYLHSQDPPIIYRDMKPGNVMLTPEGNVKIIDFGIAREYKKEGVRDTAVLGTRGYAPPEQHGKRQTDARSDIYALGMTLHHLLTGADPRMPDYEYVPVSSYNPDLSGSLAEIIDKCVSLDPKDRYGDCGELAFALEHMGEKSESLGRMQKRKKTIFFGLVLLAGALLVAGLGGSLTDRQAAAREYEEKLSVSDSLSPEEKVEAYLEAIDLSGGDTLPYIRLLEAYRENGIFGDDESAEFLEKFNANHALFDTDSEDYLNLIYQLGVTYFYLYSGGDDSFRSRVLLSYPYFREITDSGRTDYEYYETSLTYSIIGEFYEEYMTDVTGVREPGEEDYRKLLDSFNDCMDILRDYEAEDGAYIKLTFYQEAANILNNYRLGLADAGIGEDEVLDLLDLICERAEELTVTQEKSVSIQDELAADRDVYKSNIERTYINSKERSDR